MIDGVTSIIGSWSSLPQCVVNHFHDFWVRPSPMIDGYKFYIPLY